MKSAWLKGVVLLASICLSCSMLHAQEVVHALTGVLTSIDPGSSTITVKTNDGSEGVFLYKKKLNTSLEFDKSVRSAAKEPSAFKKTGDHVIVYFFGDGSRRTVVALKDLGTVPLDVSSGTIVDARDRHSLAIKTQKGAREIYKIADHATVDTSQGIVSGDKFDPDTKKGFNVTVRYATAGGTKVARFISAG